MVSSSSRKRLEFGGSASFRKCACAQPSHVYKQTGRRQKTKFYTGGFVPPKSVGLLSFPTARICSLAYQQLTASKNPCRFLYRYTGTNMSFI